MSAQVRVCIVAIAVVGVPLVFDPSSVRPFVGPKLVLTVALGALALAHVFADVRVTRLGRVPLLVGAGLVAVLAIASILSIAPAASVGGDYYRGMGLVTRLAILALALEAALAVAERKQYALILLRCVLVTSVVVGLYTIVQTCGLDPIIDPSWLEQISRSGVHETRAVATLGHANFVGQCLMFGIGAVVAAVTCERSRPLRMLGVAAGFVVASAIVASGARAAWVGLFAQLVAFGWYGHRAGWLTSLRGKKLAILCAAVLVTAAALAVSPIGRQAVDRFRSLSAEGWTGSGRTILWRDTLRMTPRYLSTGCGPDAFVLAFLPFVSPELERAEPYALFDSAHNIPLDTVVSTGAAGLALWIALVGIAGLAVARGLGSRAEDATAPKGLYLAVGIGVLGYLVDGQFLFETIPGALSFYIYVALAIGLAAKPATTAPEPSLRTWRTWLAAGLALAAVAVAGPRLRLALLADRQIQTALVLSGDGRLTEAVAMGRASVANASVLGPAPEVRHLLARIAARAGDPARPPNSDEAVLLDDAQNQLTSALASSNTPQLLHAELADIALRFGRTDTAIAELRSAVTIAPGFWAARARLAEVLLATGDRDGAVREAEAALALNPESAVARDVVARSRTGQ